MSKPKVSVLCLSYNQKDYVRQTLDGFMMQKTDFDFEILINDDASTDGTADIIHEYQQKYPDIIKPYLQKENQYSKGFRGMLTENLLPHAQGEYIALCEGDDYWTDPEKLQIQVDFMDKHADYALCFHKVRVVYEGGEKPDQIYPDVEDENWYTTEQLLRANYIQTNSVMYRKQDYKDIATHVMPGDWYLHLFHARFGKIKLIDRVMSVYRKHQGGMWWDYDVNRDEIWKKHGMTYLELFEQVLKLYKQNPEQAKIIEESFYAALDNFIAVDEKYGTSLLDQALDTYGHHIKPFIVSLHNKLHQTQLENKDLTTQLLAVGDERHDLQIELDKSHQQIEALHQEIHEVKNSQSFRTGQKLSKVRNKFRPQKH